MDREKKTLGQVVRHVQDERSEWMESQKYVVSVIDETKNTFNLFYHATDEDLDIFLGHLLLKFVDDLIQNHPEEECVAFIKKYEIFFGRTVATAMQALRDKWVKKVDLPKGGIHEHLEDIAPIDF